MILNRDTWTTTLESERIDDDTWQLQHRGDFAASSFFSFLLLFLRFYFEILLCVCVSGNVFLATCENVRTSVLFFFVFFRFFSHSRSETTRGETVCAVEKSTRALKSQGFWGSSAEVKGGLKFSFGLFLPVVCVCVCARLLLLRVYPDATTNVSSGNQLLLLLLTTSTNTETHIHSHTQTLVGRERKKKKWRGAAAAEFFFLWFSVALCSL